MQEKFQITKEGFEKLKTELHNLKNIERPKIIQAIAAARELGDLKENAEYHSAKDKQGFIEAQINDYEDKVGRAEVFDISKLSGNKIKFGATIQLEDLKNSKKITYKIVSDFESDVEKGLISSTSPVGRALLNKEVGDIVEVRVPNGIIEYEILSTKYF